MTFIDTLLDEIQTSPNLSAETRSLLADFLQSNRAWLESLGQDALARLLAALGAGTGPAAWDALIAQLDQDQLLTLLAQTSADLQDLAALRAKARADFENFVAALTAAGLRLASSALLAAL